MYLKISKNSSSNIIHQFDVYAQKFHQLLFTNHCVSMYTYIKIIFNLHMNIKYLQYIYIYYLRDDKI